MNRKSKSRQRFDTDTAAPSHSHTMQEDKSDHVLSPSPQDYYDDDYNPSLATATTVVERESCGSCCRRHMGVIRSVPSVLLIPLLVFGVIVGAGMATIVVLANQQQSHAEMQAAVQAEEAGTWFSKELQRAMLPVFSLAQFATQIPTFEELPELVGQAHAPGSLPFLTDPKVDGISTYRNLTSSACQDRTVVDRFVTIASALKQNAGMAPGVLVGLNLLPMGVICMIHPVNNTEDFPPGIFLDSTPVLGLDLLVDPDRKADAIKSINTTKDLVTIGPIELKECSLGNQGDISYDKCHPVVKQAFIARLAIGSDRHIMQIEGSKYKRWGYAEAIVNWAMLVEQSGLFEEFALQQRDFLLTRVETVCSPITGRYTAGHCGEHVVELAKTPEFDARLASKKWLAVTVELETTINDWKMTVAYPDPTAVWVPWSMLAVVVVGMCIAILVYCILFQKQTQSELTKEKRQIEKKIKSLESKKKWLEQELERQLAAALARRVAAERAESTASSLSNSSHGRRNGRKGRKKKSKRKLGGEKNNTIEAEQVSDAVSELTKDDLADPERQNIVLMDDIESSTSTTRMESSPVSAMEEVTFSAAPPSANVTPSQNAAPTDVVTCSLAAAENGVLMDAEQAPPADNTHPSGDRLQDLVEHKKGLAGWQEPENMTDSPSTVAIPGQRNGHGPSGEVTSDGLAAEKAAAIRRKDETAGQ